MPSHTFSLSEVEADGSVKEESASDDEPEELQEANEEVQCEPEDKVPTPAEVASTTAEDEAHGIPGSAPTASAPTTPGTVAPTTPAMAVGQFVAQPVGKRPECESAATPRPKRTRILQKSPAEKCSGCYAPVP
ncbi:unnamed protein product, partial [Prorocentrum cordatum]